ncbi:MAG: tRNA (adenosine(37)-N6)-dimethylallyltransferase MiaA [Candidatus Eisenbacteria bacterium]|uniref:tRNA dimethylallyltransferase n=1 Tax=Eiseniibacteriota bacterium TaxID=2212470 RepID=A0A948RSV0_UNCEI|nr:tRNA (adenosine(37)-N6)-dimethylallyltransferase MiaA [Candidatus Eisenbacteria bacterium]
MKTLTGASIVPDRSAVPSVRRIPFIVGPTGVGKTDVALTIARSGEALILSIDARQAYRRLDRATGKPAEISEREIHRLLDIWNPDTPSSAARFSKAFHDELRKARNQRRRFLAAGGSGLYIDAILGRIDPMPEIDPSLREALRREWDKSGGEALHQRLREVDPETAGRIAPRDAQRILRALEVWHQTGIPLSGWHRSGHGSYDLRQGPLIFFLARDPNDLRERITDRCRAMVEAGLVGEIRELLDEGLSPNAPGFKTLGYQEWLRYVQGECDEKSAMDQMILKTWQYARRQMTWFRNRYIGIKRIEIPPDEPAGDTAARIVRQLPGEWGTSESEP